ncbi:MAG: hypothetical protein RL172_796 [Bacteroidota bacterium]|jgi:hypothetical protein
MRHKLTITKGILLVLLLPMYIGCHQPDATAQYNPEQGYKLYVVQNSQHAWGYLVEYNNRLVIQQFSIPAVPGRQLFKTAAQATSAGKLVLYKLAHNIVPAITQKELDSLGITSLNYHASK